MVLYFSGTGNSAHIAKRIAAAIRDDVTDLKPLLLSEKPERMHSLRPWVIVCPTYAWRMPHLVSRWLKRVPLSGNRLIYFFLTCGSDTGNAGLYAEKLAKDKSLRFMGCASIVMPENYIAMFPAPDESDIFDIITAADSAADHFAELILNGKAFPVPKERLTDQIKSGITNTLFYPIFIHTKNFTAGDRCNGCGICAASCPLNNIQIKNGKPVWGESCTHCMACICRCPMEAIEYGKTSVGKRRYICPGE